MELLYKYGGVYFDLDVFWTQYLPDWLLSYPAVAATDWVQYGLAPENINNGVILASKK